MGARGMRENGLGSGEHRCPIRLDAVESTRAGETFELAPIEQARIDPRCEILEALERPSTRPLLHERIHRLLANALKRTQRIADGVSVWPIFDREMGVAGID